MQTTEFQQFFSKLNQAQQVAVSTTEGPVLVVAGPGTGKTQVLVGRIAYILQNTDTNPSSILALTFTDSAAKNMRQRLVQLIGNTAYAVRVSTFHAFCSEVIATHGEFFPLARGGDAITDLERYDLLQQSIITLPLKRLRPVGDPYCYLKDIIRAISDLKREGVSVEKFTELTAIEYETAQKQFVEWQEMTANGTKRVKGASTKKLVFDSLRNAEKNAELALLFSDFQQKLQVAKRFDFDDMISMVVTALQENEELLIEYQENLQYFLVDEYQDTNSAQDELLRKLSEYWGDQANVFVVGDPNQAIFRFQGASVENMLGFVERFPQAKVITLEQGYRCPQSFYNLAQTLISHNNLQLDTAAFSLSPQLTSSNKSMTELCSLEAPTQQLEAVFVAKKIAELIDTGAAPASIAVLYRNNADRFDIAMAMEKWQIPFGIEGGTNILDADAVTQLLTFFTALLELRSDTPGESIFQALQFSWLQLDVLTLLQLSRLSSRKKINFVTLLDQYEKLSKEWQDELLPDQAKFDEVMAVFKKMSAWSALDSELLFTEWFSRVIAESGFLTALQNRIDQQQQLFAVNALFDEIKSMVQNNHGMRLADLMKVIATFKTHDLRLMVDGQLVRPNVVCLSTAHKAKGREWDHVFVTGLVDKKWGNTVKRAKLQLPAQLLAHTQLAAKDPNEDERRLFYVAITRSKKTLWVTHPEKIIKAGRSDERIASQFLAELGSEHLQTIVDDSLMANSSEYTTRLLAPSVSEVAYDELYTQRQREFFKHLVDSYVLSITGLNTYLKDPKEFVMQHLLRVPRAKAEPMAFGTAIHSTLEMYFKSGLDTSQPPAIETAITHFETALAAEVLLPDAHLRRLEQGKEILQSYLPTQASVLPHIVFLERQLGSKYRPVRFGDIGLSGRVDRVDRWQGDQKKVVVIDYKTGQPKTVNQICGLTKSSDLSERELVLPESIRGAYKRQLLFYKLLAKYDKTFTHQVVGGRFEFVQADKQSGKIITREFELLDDEVAQLEDLIKEVVQEIRDLEFLKLL